MGDGEREQVNGRLPRCKVSGTAAFRNPEIKSKNEGMEADGSQGRGGGETPLLGFSLGRYGLHGFAHRLLVSQELHWLDGLQVLVQLVYDGDTGGKVQLHDLLLGHICGGGTQEEAY